MNSNEDIVITSAFRTPIGSFQGSLKDHKATELGATIVKKCMEHSNLSSSEVDTVILGQVLQAGCGQNPARQAAINSGINEDKTAEMARNPNVIRFTLLPVNLMIPSASLVSSPWLTIATPIINEPMMKNTESFI